jgi:purine-nucleoside phosphorylase
VKNDDAIVNPIKPKKSPDIGSLAVMAATEVDLLLLCDLLKIDRDRFHRLFNSRLYMQQIPAKHVCVTGPVVGAPYAAMILENLITWGARKILFLGWCGAVAEKVQIGDIILPTSAVIDEGTSPHYGVTNNGFSKASSSLSSMMRQVMTDSHIDFHAGSIWTTDAVYRETRQQVATHQQNGILAVEMEISALYSVARFRRVDIIGLLVVSDELSSMRWQPGFKDERFFQGRQTACEVIKKICQTSIPK